MSWKIQLVVGVMVLSGAAIWFLNTGPHNAPNSAGTALVAVTLPENLEDMAQVGSKVFAARCAACHGENAAGSDGAGPPLIHKIYEPSHHGDASFYRAVESGVRSHHWPFGDMAPVDGLTRSDVAAIIAYIRAVQRANGIS